MNNIERKMRKVARDQITKINEKIKRFDNHQSIDQINQKKFNQSMINACMVF